MSELKYNEPAERFATIVEKSLYAGATAVMVPSETGCWVHYVEYCERIANIKSEADKELRHHKYKRCLAMAEWCENALLGWMGHKESFSSHQRYIKVMLFTKWHKRWLALAEKFKEEK